MEVCLEPSLRTPQQGQKVDENVMSSRKSRESSAAAQRAKVQKESLFETALLNRIEAHNLDEADGVVRKEDAKAGRMEIHIETKLKIHVYSRDHLFSRHERRSKAHFWVARHT